MSSASSFLLGSNDVVAKECHSKARSRSHSKRSSIHVFRIWKRLCAGVPHCHMVRFQEHHQTKWRLLSLLRHGILANAPFYWSRGGYTRSGARPTVAPRKSITHAEACDIHLAITILRHSACFRVYAFVRTPGDGVSARTKPSKSDHDVSKSFYSRGCMAS